MTDSAPPGAAHKTSGVMLASYRHKIAAAVAGSGAPIVPAKWLAFGDGGHDPLSNEALPENEAATGLLREQGRVLLAGIRMSDPHTVVGEGVILAEQVPSRCVSEYALIDASGEPMAVTHTRPKYLSAGEGLDASIHVHF